MLIAKCCALIIVSMNTKRPILHLTPEETEIAERMQPQTAMGLRFKAARGKLSQKQLADAVNVHFNTIGKVERGNEPGTELLIAIARATNTSAAWLLLGDPLPQYGFIAPSLDEPAEAEPPPELDYLPTAALVQRGLEAVELGAYIYVPHFDIHASAGHGVFNDVENVIAMRPFETAYVRHKLGISHNELAMVNIVGRSMEPLLSSGDTALLDRRDREANVEGVHVIRLDGALLVKSLQRMPGRVLRVTSRNTEYASFDIKPDEDNQRDFEVLGRLRWGGISIN